MGVSIASLPSDHRYVVYRWLSSDKFMLPAIIPGATFIEARVDDQLEDLLCRIPPDAASFHFHLNCTVTGRFPASRAKLVDALHARGIAVVNGALTDISKRTVQRRCAELGLNTTAAIRNGDPDEPVIVKTDLNFGGDSEWALTSDDRVALGVGEGSQMIWKSDHYRVIPRREAEDAWWDDPTLAIERYIDNRDNRWYRAAVFFSRAVLREMVNKNQIKKVAQSVISRVWNLSIPDAEASSATGSYPRELVRDLALFAREFGIDYGAVDFVVNDAGEPHIIDVNSTPAYYGLAPEMIEFLRGTLVTSSPVPELSARTQARAI
jgi:hypothetical protein